MYRRNVEGVVSSTHAPNSPPIELPMKVDSSAAIEYRARKSGNSSFVRIKKEPCGAGLDIRAALQS
jgi:hypothetical protein